MLFPKGMGQVVPGDRRGLFHCSPGGILTLGRQCWAVCGRQQGQGRQRWSLWSSHCALLSCSRLFLSVSWRIQECAFCPGSPQLCGPGSHGQNQAGKDGTTGGWWGRWVGNRSCGDLGCLLRFNLGTRGSKCTSQNPVCALGVCSCGLLSTGGEGAVLEEKGRADAFVLCRWLLPDRLWQGWFQQLLQTTCSILPGNAVSGSITDNLCCVSEPKQGLYHQALCVKGGHWGSAALG